MRETQREIERETEREHCLYVSLEGSKSTTAVTESQDKGVERGLTPLQWCVSRILWSGGVYSSILLFCIAGIYPRLTFNQVSQADLLPQSLKCWITGMFHQGQPGKISLPHIPKPCDTPGHTGFLRILNEH